MGAESWADRLEDNLDVDENGDVFVASTFPSLLPDNTELTTRI